MLRTTLMGAMVLSASFASSARAQDFTPPALPDLSSAQPIAAAPAAFPAPSRPAGHVAQAQASCPADAAAQGSGMAAAPGVVNYPAGGGYPKLNAPLYPSPQQGTQPWTHGTIITNQALAPHEMLYPHKYHAMYGPFYYRVRGCWVMTPVGMRQHEKWELQGTEVKVNYRSTYAPFSGFHPRIF